MTKHPETPSKEPSGQRGLYDPRQEHDSCGVGFVARVDGQPRHEIVEQGVRVLENLLHRGAVGGDLSTGDGAGVLTQVPDAFFRRECERMGVRLPRAGAFGVAVVFGPREPGAWARLADVIRAAVAAEGLGWLGWREVPTDEGVLGETARHSRPAVWQAFLDGAGEMGDVLERRLYFFRKRVERISRESLPAAERGYIPSCSSRTVVYKGLLMGAQVSGFYRDLKDPAFVSALAVVHQRYSTNTFPSWQLAQPFRFLAHNGEINTLRGNRLQIMGREPALRHERFGPDIRKLTPVVEPDGSDSAALDNVLELLVQGGRSLAHSIMMLIPEAWGPKYPMGPDQRGFFEYHAGLMEPWDGPATVVFSDGRQVGGWLDRNGLRPARYTITRDGLIVMASETGVLDLPREAVLEQGSLRPGQMILVDLERQRILKDGEIKSLLSRRQPYRRWVEENKVTVQGLFGTVAPVQPDRSTLPIRQRLFGYTREDLQVLLAPMASKGHEPVGSMGADTPLAVLSEKPQLLFSYFKQMFAQVTNPPIDPIREELVMSLMTFIGNPANILEETPRYARLIKLRHPILSGEDTDRLRNLRGAGFEARELPMGFPGRGDGGMLAEAVNQLIRRAEAAVRNGQNLLILTDRHLPDHQAAIPSLLAVSAVNRHLMREGLRSHAGLIVETGEAREVMHMALLLGYGATAVHPYLALETVADLALTGELEGDISVVRAMENYIASLCEGLRKIMSKMGISTLRSYRGAQVFEAVGLAASLVDRYFEGTASRVGGIGLAEIAAEANARWMASRDRSPAAAWLPSGGLYRYRADGERHLWTPETISDLQQAVRRNDRTLYRRYADRINNQIERPTTLRGLMRLKTGRAVPLERVEPAEAIFPRFVTGAMSFGSISREAHEALAIAMNRLGAKSNSGEGGEDPARYEPLPNGDSRCSAIKQVASGRFGVTAEYCVNCRELQIKIAQGAKPGEGGQLPGHKVNAEIARVRHSTPGVTLISPPPHHDIYSIEDIKQLIFDLKNVNPEARVSVKLVAELGVGTVAAGVTKAGADAILISGYDGGTGASPLSSIRHAGIPWELGLSETQQTLVLNGLRSRVRLQVDGQMKTGRDVIIAALLGAEEFGFATAPLVCLGCVMMRKCHQNTCPVGVATQDPRLRKLFQGRPEHVINYFRFVAEEVRELMAALGFERLDDLIGRSDLLEKSEGVTFWKAGGLDFSAILAPPDSPGPRRCVERQRDELADTLDWALMPEVMPAIEGKGRVELRRPIRNIHRAVGTMISGRVARRYGHAGLPEDSIVVRFQGVAGQSFGAWCARGVTLILEGEANDYVGKGLSGGRIIVRPPAEAPAEAFGRVIAGNVLLYGAVDGEAYFAGQAGERFAVRNSGAMAVVEGVGDHGCEYMTGGRVVVLGPTGINFAAGMSGGIAYVYDRDRLFDTRCNLDMVDLEPVLSAEDEAELRGMIERHARHTGSPLATNMLETWDEVRPYFVKVFPIEYRRALGRMSRDDEATEREEVAHG